MFMRHRGGGVGHQRPSYSIENDIVGEVGEEEEADDEFAEIDQDEGEMEDEEEDEYAEEDEDLLNEGEEWDSVWAEDEEEEDDEDEPAVHVTSSRFNALATDDLYEREGDDPEQAEKWN